MAVNFDPNVSLDFGSLSALDNQSEISVAGFAKYDTTSGDRALVSNRSGNGFEVFRDETGFSSGRKDCIQVSVQDDGASATIEGAANSLATTNTWFHLAATFVGGDANGLRAYIDGVEDAQSPVSTASVADSGGGSNFRIGQTPSSSKSMNGDLAEVAVWTRALSAGEIAALAKGFSPLFFPKDLAFYCSVNAPTPEANIDLVGGATATKSGSGTLAKAAHPRIIYPRRSRLVFPPVLAVRAATAGQTLNLGQSADCAVIAKAVGAQSIGIAQTSVAASIAKAVSSQTLSIGQAVSGDVKVKATAGQSLAVGQNTAAKLLLKASGAQALGIGQATSARLIAKSAAAQSLAIGQVAFVGDLPGFIAAQSLQIGQSASADLSNLFVTGTDILDLPVDCVLAGQQEQFRERIREFDIRPRNMKTRGTFGRSRLATLSNQKPTFKVTTNKTGRD